MTIPFEGLAGRITLLAATAALAAAPLWARADGAAAEFDQALVHYEIGHYADAYRTLARLADSGHADAARIALQMWRHGRALYFMSFDASADQVERWAKLQGCGATEPAAAHCRVAQKAS